MERWGGKGGGWGRIGWVGKGVGELVGGEMIGGKGEICCEVVDGGVGVVLWVVDGGVVVGFGVVGDDVVLKGVDESGGGEGEMEEGGVRGRGGEVDEGGMGEEWGRFGGRVWENEERRWVWGGLVRRMGGR